MLKFKKQNVNFFYLLLMLFFTTNTFADTQYYKCKEKISKILKGKNKNIQEGSITGTNYISIRNNFVTIKFKYPKNLKKTDTIISNERMERTLLGYEIFKKNSDNNSITENSYTFVKLGDTYAISRKFYYWSSKTKEQNKENYEYESASRCIKINYNEFKSEKVIKIVKKEKPKQETKKQTSSKFIKGKRSFGLSWEGYDEFILGNVKFSEIDLIGILEFSLPKNDGSCVGTYVLSSNKGTWSIYCKDKDINASGTLKWNQSDGSVNGNGKDSKGKKVKFKVAPIN